MSNTIRRSVRECYCPPKERNNEIWISRLRSWILSKKGNNGKSQEREMVLHKYLWQDLDEIMPVSLGLSLEGHVTQKDRGSTNTVTLPLVQLSRHQIKYFQNPPIWSMECQGSLLEESGLTGDFGQELSVCPRAGYGQIPHVNSGHERSVCSRDQQRRQVSGRRGGNSSIMGGISSHPFPLSNFCSERRGDKEADGVSYSEIG